MAQVRSSRAIGIIGGMGPAATADLFTKILAATGATRDQDHLRLIVDSNPAIADRNAALDDTGPSPGPILAAMANKSVAMRCALTL